MNGRKAYLITFSCYGSRMHGDGAGRVDRKHNVPGSPFVPIDSGRAFTECQLMGQPLYSLDQPRRAAVLACLREVCSQRGWTLLAAHVRTTHVHVIAESDEPAEQMMNAFKSYASRRLNESGWDGPGRKGWTRGGSIRRLWKRESVLAAIRYVVDGQGTPMAVYEEPLEF
jgi:REP element-mobilizing transposase RayT